MHAPARRQPLDPNIGGEDVTAPGAGGRGVEAMGWASPSSTSSARTVRSPPAAAISGVGGTAPADAVLAPTNRCGCGWALSATHSRSPSPGAWALAAKRGRRPSRG